MHTEQSMVRQKHYHDRKLHWNTFSPGFTFRGQSQESLQNLQHFGMALTLSKSRLSDVTYLVDCGRNGRDQVIHVDRMRPLRSQILTGEMANDESSVKDDDTEASGSDMESETDERADEEHEAEVPSARRFREQASTSVDGRLRYRILTSLLQVKLQIKQILKVFW